MSANTVRTSPVLLAHLTRLVEAGGRRTVTEVGSNAIYMARLERQGLVKVSGQVHTGRRGRPANLYVATDAGRKRARRALARQS